MQDLEQNQEWLLQSLNVLASIGEAINKQDENGNDNSQTYELAAQGLERISEISQCAFYEIDDDGLDFQLTWPKNKQNVAQLKEIVAQLIDDGTFAWALYENRLILLDEVNPNFCVLLHVISTKAKTLGMFVGLVEKSSSIPAITHKLISLIMFNVANVVDSALLNQKLKVYNDELEHKVSERTQDLENSRKKLHLVNLDLKKQISAIEASADGICILDEHRRHISANHAYAKIYQWPDRTELLGKSRAIVETKEQEEHWQKTVLPQLKTDKHWRGELTGIKKNKASFTCEVSYTLLDEGGFICVVRDISIRKQAQKEHLELQKQLMQSQKLESIGQLAGGIAHDFNNLLGGMLGYASLLESKLKKLEDPSLMKGIQTIIQSAKRGSELTRGLLDFARKKDTEKKLVNVNTIIEEVEHLLSSSLPRNISIDLSLTENLGVIEANANQIYQVIMNLAINAKDAMANGGKIEISSRNITLSEEYCRHHYFRLKAGHYCLISVKDNGSGIPESVINKIFDPFFTTKGVGKGTGLGLSTAYGIIENHKGWIDVYTEPGNGTVFHLYFPFVKDTTKTNFTLQKKTSEAPTQINHPLFDKKILILEDNDAILSLLIDCLKEKGYHLETAMTIHDAKYIFEQASDNFDLVIMDMKLPDGSGEKLYKKIHKVKPNQKVIVSSGFASNGSLAIFDGKKQVTFLAKPYTEEELYQKMAKLFLESTENQIASSPA